MENLTYFDFIKSELITTNNNLVQEGLLHSVSYSIFIKKLTDLLNKYNVIFNIDKSPDNIKLNIQISKNKYLYNDIESLLNLCGYYVSFWYDENNIKYISNISIKSFMNNKNMIIYFNKKFDFEENGLKVFMYHVTDEIHINKILRYGIEPKSGKKIDNHPERIYLFDTITDALNFSSNIKTPKILKIDLRATRRIKLYSDPKYPNYDAFYTYDNIPNFALEEIKI